MAEVTPSGWTVDTLLELMNERDRRYEQRFIAQEKAMELALVERREQIGRLAQSHAALERDIATLRSEVRQANNMREYLKEKT